MKQTPEDSVLIAPENRDYERHLRTYVARHAGALFSNWDFDAASDPVEAIHDLRVASRRLRALLEVLGFLVPEHVAQRRSLRKVTRGAGALREWDVNSQYLAEMVGRAASHLEAAALEYVAVRVDEHRADERKATAKRLSRLSPERIQKGLHDLVEALVRAVLVAPLDELGRAALEPRTEALLTSLPDAKADASGEHLHQVRIHIKRLRYAVELLAPLLGEGYGSIHKQLKGLQQDLGRHHDLFVLQGVLLAERDFLVAQGRKHLVMGLAGPLHHVAAEQRELADAFLRGSESFDPDGFRQLMQDSLRGPAALR
ncbi:MAG: CHAD domain-containing protein [Polyangiaceae bacterium]